MIQPPAQVIIKWGLNPPFCNLKGNKASSDIQMEPAGRCAALRDRKSRQLRIAQENVKP